MDILVDIHNYLRWVLLALLVLSVLAGIYMLTKKGGYPSGIHRIYQSAMILIEVQVVLGMILYFVNKSYLGFQHMDDSMLRFYALEHPLGMIVAIGLMSVGWGRAKRATEPLQKHKKIVLFYALGLLIILVSIPWSFRISGSIPGN